MSAPDIAYRLACAPVAAIGGPYAQQVALLVACRWAQPDGRFAVRQTTIADASGLSEATVGRAFRALRAAGIAVPLTRDEFRLVADHLPDLSLRRQRHLTDGSTTDDGTSHRKGSRLTDGSPSSASETPPRGSPIPQTATTSPQTATAVPGTESVYPLIVDPASSPSGSVEQGEGERARASTRPADVSPTDGLDDVDRRRLDWLRTQGVLLVNPATAECLRREWLQLTVGLGGDLVRAILAVRGGDYPSDFRKASEPFATQIDCARRLRAERAAAALPDQEAARLASERLADEGRQRGPWLEQGRALVAEVLAADPRRLRAAEQLAGWNWAMQPLREGVRAGAVQGRDLRDARDLWAKALAAPLPPEPPPAAREPPATRSFTEPADAEPAAP